MGYESRLIIADRCEIKDTESGKVTDIYAHRIAVFDMAVMGGGFKNIFTKPIDFDIYSPYGEENISNDKYGDKCVYTDIQTVINYVKNDIETKEYYRRMQPLLAFLKALKPKDWSELIVIHYGY